MNKITKIWAPIAAVLLAVLMPVVFVNAAELRSGERMSVTASEEINDDLYAAGGLVTTSAEVNGDLYTAGGSVTIDGSVDDDLQAAGGTVSVLSDISGDARIGGGNLTVSGSIGEDLIVLGGQTQVSSDQIGGDLVWVGGTLNLNAPVDGDLTLKGNKAYINSEIAGDVNFRGQQLVLESGATIEGDLSYQSPNQVRIADGASVGGETSYESITTNEASNTSNFDRLNFFSTIGSFLWILMQLAGALLIGLLFKRFTGRVVDNAYSRPLVEFARGFAGLLIIPVGAVLLFATLIGLPLGILAFLLYFALMIITTFVAPILIGSIAYQQMKQVENYTVSWLTITLGVLLYALIGYIPVIGWIVQFVFAMLALGAIFGIIWHQFNTYRK